MHAFGDGSFHLFACNILSCLCICFICFSSFLLYLHLLWIKVIHVYACVSEISICMLYWCYVCRYNSSYWQWRQYCICTSCYGSNHILSHHISNSGIFSVAKNIVVWSLFCTTDSCSQISSQCSSFHCLLLWCSPTVESLKSPVAFGLESMGRRHGQKLPLYIFCIYFTTRYFLDFVRYWILTYYKFNLF